ncbi:MAG TPA: hypothetical protein DIU15_12000 [Deltaproteobacteria bacterium]|nr:hypothetical protein [Deltaproteobacteria bacterium]HCP46760.1 hypothetical protein [Deltaproteobacteria bacterium]
MGTRTRLVGRHIATFGGVVFVSSIVFGALVWWAPGSPQRIDAGAQLDQGFWGWLLSFWLGLIQFDLGPSYRGIPVDQLLVKGAIKSLPLIVLSMILSVGGSLLAVAIMGTRASSSFPLVRTAIHSISLVPVFLLGYLAVVLFAVPPDGVFQALAAIAILAVGDGMLTDIFLGIDDEVDQLLDRDFVHSARLRGVPVGPTLARHLALPLAQIAADKMAYVVGGVLVIEKVLGIQGIGWMGYRAATHHDFLLLLAITVAVTSLVAASQLGVDLVRLATDPRTTPNVSGQEVG